MLIVFETHRAFCHHTSSVRALEQRRKRFCKNNLKNLQDAPKMPFQLTFMSSRRDCCARMSHVKKHMCRQFMKHLCILNEAPFLEICHNQNYQKKYICKYFSLRNIVQPPTLSRSFQAKILKKMYIIASQNITLLYYLLQTI